MTDLTEAEINGDYVRGGVIRIPITHLPDVYDDGKETSMGDPRPNEYSACVRDDGQTPDYHLRAALCHLAMREYKLAKHHKTKEIEFRRNYLAAKFHAPIAKYENMTRASQAAIDYIIELEDRTNG